MKQTNVAVAVIHYGTAFLLGYRNVYQHQGNRYEFIGGKIEANETSKQALIREVKEEIGLDISSKGSINQLGMLCHEYHDMTLQKKPKKVCLYVYRVVLTQEQYLSLYNQKLGCEGQSLYWANEKDLLSNSYPLPEANKTILDWLKLSSIITITKDIADTRIINKAPNNIPSNKISPENNINTQSTTTLSIRTQAIQKWVDYYSKRISKNGCVYVRLKQLNLQQQVEAVLILIKVRPDLKVIISPELAHALHLQNNLPKQVIAQHLTQKALENIVSNHAVSNNYEINKQLIQKEPDLPITVSCHDKHSIKKANHLAQYLINNKLPVIVGMFISPVKKTQSHPRQVPLGFSQFEIMASHADVPVIALGGLSPDDLQEVRVHSGDKVAGINNFLITDV